MPGRSRKETKRYTKHQKSVHVALDCIFCTIHSRDKQHISETKSFKIIHNIYGYSYWDMKNVEDHLMVIPKKHTDTLGDLTRSEAVEYMDIITSYEGRGYNIYARAPADKTKSVAHQHTHLIKPGKKFHKFVFFIRKPYIRLVR